MEALRAKGNFYLLAIDAEPHIRYERAFERASDTDHVEYATFMENEQREMESDDPNKQNLSACIKLANYTIQNNGTIDELHVAVERILADINPVTAQLPTWDEYFIEIAKVTARRSKDPSTKTGCVIVDPNNRPVSFGYNGFIG